MASGSVHRLARIVEATRGTTPATPAFATLRDGRLTGGLTRASLKSEAVRNDRQISGFRLGQKSLAFSIPFELSYGSYDAELEALLQGTWTNDVLKAGVTRRYHTYERYFEDLEVGSNKYHRYVGSELNTMELTIATNAIGKGTFGLIGMDVNLATAEIEDSTYAAASTTELFTAFDGVLSEGGSPIAVATELKLNLNNGIEPSYVIGSTSSNLASNGDSELTGTLGLQFVDTTTLEKFINETESSLAIVLTDAAGNELTIEIPRVVYTGGSPDVGGKGLIQLSMPFQALYDDTAESNIVITRDPVT